MAKKIDAAALRRVTALSVELHGRRVGVLNRLHGEKTVFSFTDDYLNDPKRPTLSLSFKGEAGGIVPPRLTQNRLPTFFANLLPEGRLRAYLAERIGVNPQQEFFLLAALGLDLPGAVAVKPMEAEGAIIATISNHRGERDWSGPLRFSLAGIQLKFSAIAEARGRFTIPAQGVGGSWILKLPAQNHPEVPRNEYAMMRLASRIGINVPEVRLVRVEEIKGLPEEISTSGPKKSALSIRRFDRTDTGSRIHMEDFAQIFGLFPEKKYETKSYASIAAVLRAESNLDTVMDFVRRVAFSVAIGNGDAHLKNWTLLYPDKVSPVLAPAYDLVSTVPYIPRDHLGLGFGKEKRLDGISRDQIRRFSETAGVPKEMVLGAIREVMESVPAAWASLEEKDLLSRKLRASIDAQIAKATKATRDDIDSKHAVKSASQRRHKKPSGRR